MTLQRIGRYFDIEFDSITVNPFQSNSQISFLDLFEPGIHFLLGKNGAGKSRLIDSLSAFVTGSESAFSVSLIGKFPTQEKLEGLKIAIDDFISSAESVESELEQQYDYANPTFLNCVIESFWESQRIYKEPFTFYSEKEILEWFGFPKEDVDRWEKYFSLHIESKVVDGIFLPGEHKFNKLKESYFLSDHKCQIFLAWLSSSTINFKDRYHSPVWITDSTEWIESKEKANLVLQAFCEFIDSVTHIEVIHQRFGDHRKIKNFASVPANGQVEHLIAAGCDAIHLLEEFAKTRQITWIDVDGKENGSPIDVSECFPFDLFYGIVRPDGKFTQSISITLKENFFDDHLFRTSYQLLGFHDLDKEQSLGIETCIKSYLTQLHEIKIGDKGSEEGVQFNLKGFDKSADFLKTLSKYLSKVQIGISQIIEKKPNFKHLPWENDIPESITLNSELQLIDSQSKEIFPFAAASSGQKDVIAILFWLLTIGTEDCLIAVATLDEFDRHLQSAAAEKLLYQINELSRERNLVTIVSTHRIPQFSSPLIRQRPRIFAHKNISNQPVFTASESIPTEVLTELLGVHANEALNLKKLRILVEGNHDAMIIRHLIESSRGIKIDDVDFVVANGSYAFASLWKYKFANDEIPVMIVHDKRNSDVERAFNKAQDLAKKPGMEDRIWKESGLLEILLSLKKRDKDNAKAKRKKNQGDAELGSLIWLIQKILAHRYSRENNENWNTCTDLISLQKVEIIGLDCDDIVDLLPIVAFSKAKEHGSWKKAHAIVEANDGKEFKLKLEINETSIENALESIKNNWHPELTRLSDAISKYDNLLNSPATL